jgi:hypothetical protein
MKKVSTMAAKQSRNFSQQKLTLGLDLGDRSSYSCVLDETGLWLLEHKVATTSQGLQAAFAAIPRSRVALATGMHSPWPTFHGCVKPQVANQWKHRLKREHSTGTERKQSLIKSADGRVATAVVTRQIKPKKHAIKIRLTPTGLLMEGDYTPSKVTGNPFGISSR